MRSRIQSILWSWLLVATAASLAACAPAKPVQSELLRALDVNAAEFSQMPTCEQVRLYTDFGSRYLDIDHSIALTPAWMNDALAAQPRDQVVHCIALEGAYRLRLLAGGLESIDDASLQVHALAYQARELKLLADPGMQSFMEEAVCSNRLRHDPILVLVFYYGKFTKSPPYIGQSDDIGRMRAELCP
jgi:hypothetical protein